MPRDLGVEVVSAHHERAVLAVGDVVLKISGDSAQLDREVAAMDLAAAAGIPVPEVRWRRREVLAMSRLGGRPLGRLGSPSDAPPAAWAASGAMLRRLHTAPRPPWPAATTDDAQAAMADGTARWIVDRGLVEQAVVERARARMGPALRPHPLVFTHGDFQPAHVFVDDAGDVVGIIDWADAEPGDALVDVAVLTVGFEERLDDVLRGYGDEVDLEVIRAHWAWRRLGAVRWMVEHGFDASGDVAALRATV